MKSVLSLVLSRQELGAFIECRVETPALENIVSNQLHIDLQGNIYSGKKKGKTYFFHSLLLFYSFPKLNKSSKKLNKKNKTFFFLLYFTGSVLFYCICLTKNLIKIKKKRKNYVLRENDDE